MRMMLDVKSGENLLIMADTWTNVVKSGDLLKVMGPEGFRCGG